VERPVVGRVGVGMVLESHFVVVLTGRGVEEMTGEVARMVRAMERRLRREGIVAVEVGFENYDVFQKLEDIRRARKSKGPNQGKRGLRDKTDVRNLAKDYQILIEALDDDRNFMRIMNFL